METAAVLVAIGFGLLMGFTLGRYVPDLRPVLAGLAFGLACGACAWLLELGDEPGFVAGSLMLGCGAALTGLAASRLTRPSGSPSPPP